MRKHSLVLVCAFALITAGVQAQTYGTPTTRPQPAAQPAQTAAPAGSVHVMLSEYTIQMPDTLPPGRTTFHVMNHGMHKHGLEAHAQGTNVNILSSLDPGKTGTAAVELKPGNYTFYCPVGDHASAHQMTKAVTVQAGGASMHARSSTDNSRTALSKAMRDLWADHVVWTRNYIIAASTDSPDAQAAATRLLANQDDLGRAIVPYYGEAAGSKLASLLRDHILIAVDLVAAAKANDQTKQTDADRRWHANAADIAAFLSGANPNWPRAAVLSMMNEHLALTTQEAVARLKKDWSGDVATFDMIFDQAIMMADALTDGIVKQFPERFRG
jgi:uncharacterized cupredoxin-like copper-binding protein